MAALQKKWTNVATAVAVAILAEKDVTVTNQSDKDFLLGKLPYLEKELMALAKDVPELAAVLAAAPGDTVESLRAQLAAMTQRAEAAETENGALKEENTALKAAKSSAIRGSEKVQPTF